MEHDHNFLSTKGPGQSARDPLSGLRATMGAADKEAAEPRENARNSAESTYTVHVDRTGDVPVVSVSYTKLGIAIWNERPMADGDWMELAMILRG